MQGIKLNIFSITKSGIYTLDQFIGKNTQVFDYALENTGGSGVLFQNFKELDADRLLSIAGYNGCTRKDSLNIKFTDNENPNNKILLYINSYTV